MGIFVHHLNTFHLFNYCPTGGGLVQQRRDQPQRRVEEVHGHWHCQCYISTHFFFMINLPQILLTFWVGRLSLKTFYSQQMAVMMGTYYAMDRMSKTKGEEKQMQAKSEDIFWNVWENAKHFVLNFCLQVEGEVWLLTQPLWLVWSSTRSTRNPAVA